MSNRGRADMPKPRSGKECARRDPIRRIREDWGLMVICIFGILATLFIAEWLFLDVSEHIVVFDYADLPLIALPLAVSYLDDLARLLKRIVSGPSEDASARTCCQDTLCKDMNQEREFIENLQAQRFNFFIVFYTIVVGGALGARTDMYLQLIMGLGVVVCILIAKTLFRSQEKLDILIGHLKMRRFFPISLAEGMANPRGSRRHLIGCWIPMICTVAMYLAYVASVIGLLPAPK